MVVISTLEWFIISCYSWRFCCLLEYASSLLCSNETAFIDLFKASASASGSNIERSLIEFNSTEKGVYLPPQNLRNFDSSLVFVPITPQTALPASNETSDKLFNEKKNGLLLTPPGLALSLMFEHELGLSFRKINLLQMQQLLRN